MLSRFQFYLIPEPLIFLLIMISVISYSDIKILWLFAPHDNNIHLLTYCTFKPVYPPVKYFYWPFQGGASFVDLLCYFCLVLLCFHARLFVDALWSPAGKLLTSWLSFVMSNCDVVTFPLVSWVRCGAWLYISIPDLCPISYFQWGRHEDYLP